MLDNVEVCNCGRDRERRHCPSCGHLNYYALKLVTKRPHPQTGVIAEVSTFRCRTCNIHFDDLQWQYECKAPRSLRAQQKEVKAFTRDSLIQQADSGDKFNENDKRHFRKYVGVTYDEYMMLRRNAQHRKQIALEQQVKKITTTATPPVVTNGKLTPYQWHLENCNHCMTHNDNCEIGQQLLAAEKMEQQP